LHLDTQVMRDFDDDADDVNNDALDGKAASGCCSSDWSKSVGLFVAIVNEGIGDDVTTIAATAICSNGYGSTSTTASLLSIVVGDEDVGRCVVGDVEE
jgi:hypothetical protein